MDFGVVTCKHPSSPSPSVEDQKCSNNNGSTNLKRQRSGLVEDTWKLPKMVRNAEGFEAFGRSNLWPSGVSNDGQKMLSFSSSQPLFTDSSSTRSITFSLSQDGSNGGAFGRGKGPFTPSQWMELEHQALIYKHIVANVPVPSNLLLPLRRSFCSYGSYASNFLGWGHFHLGLSGSNDPEPGRCRRTDGKKWRCSRDAVPDQKYCERHINRGRHRSRKPVEGHTGHTVAGSTVSKVAPIASSSSAASVMSSSSASNSVNAMQNRFGSLQPNTAGSTNHLVSRSLEFQGLSLIPPTINLKSKDHVPYPIEKGNLPPPFEESPNSEFGLVSSDSLLNPSEGIPYMDNCNPDGNPLLRFDAKDDNHQQPVHHFIDDWPKDQLHRSSGSWPEELKSDWTQLSMSIPVAPDFSSSSSSPSQEKSSLSILRLSHEIDPIQMSLGMSHDLGQPIQKQPMWLPVTWGNSMGGPLGEALTSTSIGVGIGESLSCLKTWNNSPNGVLNKSAINSVSNSSSAGSPTSTDNKIAVEKAARICNELLGSSAPASSASIPSQ